MVWLDDPKTVYISNDSVRATLQFWPDGVLTVLSIKEVDNGLKRVTDLIEILTDIKGLAEEANRRVIMEFRNVRPPIRFNNRSFKTFYKLNEFHFIYKGQVLEYIPRRNYTRYNRTLQT